MLQPYPLTKTNRLRLARAFRPVPRVDLSIPCVLEGQMGSAAVDDPLQPAVFQVQTGPFLYFAGDPAGPAGQALLRSLTSEFLLMPSAPGWLEALQAQHGERLKGFDRYSFSSENLSAGRLQDLYTASPFRERVQRIDAALLERLWSQGHFIDLSDYESPGDFLERGIGFFAAEGNEMIGSIFGSLACSQGIEVSLYVQPSHRRQGLATALSSRLLLWCLENGVDPHWDAANPESCRLALKLGYTPAGSYLAHYLEG